MTIYLMEATWDQVRPGDSAEIDVIFAKMAEVENLNMSFLGLVNSLPVAPENFGADYPYAVHLLGPGGITPRDFGNSPLQRIYDIDIVTWLICETRNKNIETLQEETKFWVKAFEKTYGYNRGLDGAVHWIKIVGARWQELNWGAGESRQKLWGWRFAMKAEAHKLL